MRRERERELTVTFGRATIEVTVETCPFASVETCDCVIEARKKRWPGSAFSPQSDSRRRVEREGLKRELTLVTRMPDCVMVVSFPSITVVTAT